MRQVVGAETWYSQDSTHKWEVITIIEVFPKEQRIWASHQAPALQRQAAKMSGFEGQWNLYMEEPEKCRKQRLCL